MLKEITFFWKFMLIENPNENKNHATYYYKNIFTNIKVILTLEISISKNRSNYQKLLGKFHHLKVY